MTSTDSHHLHPGRHRVLAVSTAAAQRAPAAAPTKLPADVLALACAPSLTYEAPVAAMRVTGGQDSFVRRIHAPGDLVTINAGTDNGIKVGQEFYVRRVYRPARRRSAATSPATVRTAGWIRVYAVDPAMSLATVTHACDTIEIDDYLEPFALPQVPAAADIRSKPEHDNYGRVMTGADRAAASARATSSSSIAAATRASSRARSSSSSATSGAAACSSRTTSSTSSARRWRWT